MGILDQQSRIVDFKLTQYGREALSHGGLQVEYYAFFDDGVDYDVLEPNVIDHSAMPEAISNADYMCKNQLGTVDLNNSNVKPYMYVSTGSVYIKKQQQESLALGDLILDDVVDVYIETEVENYIQDEPLYVPVPAGFIPVPKVVIGAPADSYGIDGTDYPDEVGSELQTDINAPLGRVVGTIYNSVLSVTEPIEIELKLFGAKVHDGFRIEVFYSGTASSEVSGANFNIKLTEDGVDQTVSQYYDTNVSDLPDVPKGYGSWFKIVTE